MRNYHVKRKDQFMRPDLERKQFWTSFFAAVQIIAGLMLVLAIYGWMGARDAEAHSSALLGQYMTHGFVEDSETIFMCGSRAYEVVK